MRKIHIKTVSRANLVLAIIMGALCVGLFVFGLGQYVNMQNASDTYVKCENAAQQLKDASNDLTEECRLVVMTGEMQYVEQYFNEKDEAKNREQAVETLESCLPNSDAVTSLESALEESNRMAKTEVYAIRLKLESQDSQETWPDEVKHVKLSAQDKKLSNEGKAERAKDLVFGSNYRSSRAHISKHIDECTQELVSTTENARNHASSVFIDTYRKLAVVIVIFVVLALATALVTRKLIVKPLLSYNESIKLGEIFPVIGAAELQNLAATYNRVYQESKERQLLIQHQAEHDALTDLLNRGSYDSLLDLYESEGASFALVLVDVDTFKQVNDGYGHEMGDRILKRVSDLLKQAFRNVDHVCRIGGDEFAVIMVEMTSNLRYAIEDKVASINDQLQHPTDDLPPVSLSVGVVFADTKSPADDMYKDADEALYHTKENGRCGISFFGDF